MRQAERHDGEDDAGNERGGEVACEEMGEFHHEESAGQEREEYDRIIAEER